MDLSTIFTADAHEEGAELRIVDINGKETDIYITVKGIHSKTWRDATREADKAKLYGKPERSWEDRFAEITISWRGMPDPSGSGQEFPFSRDNARLIYEKAPIITKQIDAFVAKLGNFTKGSVKKS